MLTIKNRTEICACVCVCDEIGKEVTPINILIPWLHVLSAIIAAVREEKKHTKHLRTNYVSLITAENTISLSSFSSVLCVSDNKEMRLYTRRIHYP